MDFVLEFFGVSSVRQELPDFELSVLPDQCKWYLLAANDHCGINF